MRGRGSDTGGACRRRRIYLTVCDALRQELDKCPGVTKLPSYSPTPVREIMTPL
jgi:hypothetical protein